MTSSSIVYVRPRALVMMAVMLSSIPTRLLFRQQMVCGGSVVFQPSRGSKKKWGSTARDPYDHLKKKLAVASLNKHAKVPLKSKERATRELAYPINIQSLGTNAYTVIHISYGQKIFGVKNIAGVNHIDYFISVYKFL